MLQQEKPEDYVIATGVTTTVREFIKMAFAEAGITVQFSGSGLNEKGTVVALSNADVAVKVGSEVVAIDANYYRPTEVDLLIGNPAKANMQLGWKPKFDLKMLVHEMVEADTALFKREKLLKDQGFKVFNQYE
jgi:GDPmannose 4,6-dehydratase